MNLLKYLLTTMLAICFCLPWQKRKAHFALRMAIGMLLVYVLCWITGRGLVSVIGDSIWTSAFRYLFSFALLILVLSKCYAVPLWHIFFSATCGYSAQNAGHYLTAIVYESTPPFLAAQKLLLCESVSFVLLYTVIFFLARRFRRSDAVSVNLKTVYLISSFTVLFTIILSDQIPYGKQYLLFYLYSFAIAIGMFLFHFVLYEKYGLVHDLDVINQMLILEQKQHQLSADAVALINQKCHDLKYMIAAFQKDGKLPSGLAEEITGAIGSYEAAFKTGNDTLDIILTEKSFQCEKKGIDFSCMLDGRLFAAMDPVDLSSLFGNLLDNAIESVAQQPEEHRHILLKSMQQGNLVFLHAENPCPETLIFENGLPVTTKTDHPGYHGYGVKNIQFLVSKYRGFVKMRQADARFITDICLPAPASRTAEKA